jgi:lipoprotein-anchoring transpeptidase ErfK/SrfK
MKRRTFLALGITGVILVRAGEASATSESVLPDTPSPDLPEAANVDLPETSADELTEQFPISQEDYLLVKAQFRPQIVDFPTRETPGTIVIDTRRRFLYFILGTGKAKRYGVGVGRRGFQWSGTATIGRKAKWPVWIPPPEMMERDREAAKWPDGMPGGPGNPLGARALYLYQNGADTLYRIHGTREPRTIGRAVSSGCVRMLNADAADLFERAPIGTKVVVVGPTRRPPLFRNEFANAFRSTLGTRPTDGWRRLKRDLRRLFPGLNLR